MSMTRNEAIKWFACDKHIGISAGDAFKSAPAAVVNGLATQDLTLISRFHSEAAVSVVGRLHRRTRLNPNGTHSVGRK